MYYNLCLYALTYTCACTHAETCKHTMHMYVCACVSLTVSVILVWAEWLVCKSADSCDSG